MTTIMLNAWPTILMLSVLASYPRRSMLIAAFFALTAVTVFASNHDSSQFALLGSAIVFLIARSWPRFIIRSLAVLWRLAFVLVLPASFLAYNAKLHLYPSVSHSYKSRIILWDYTREKTLERPLFGVGVNSTREMDETRRNAQKDKAGMRSRRRSKGASFPRTTGHHGHNVFLQTWFELGAVGAILFALAGALVVLRAQSWSRSVQPYAAAAFTAFASIAAFAWGMWQSWWMCAVGLIAIYLCLGRQLNALQPRPSPGAGAEAPRQHS